jgi:hypothetical protein
VPATQEALKELAVCADGGRRGSGGSRRGTMAAGSSGGGLLLLARAAYVSPCVGCIRIDGPDINTLQRIGRRDRSDSCMPFRVYNYTAERCSSDDSGTPACAHLHEHDECDRVGDWHELEALLARGANELQWTRAGRERQG